MSQKTVRLTMAQAVARFLTRQMTIIDGERVPIFGGVFAIFGHGNVAGVGEALYGVRETLPTYRGQNEQGMANAGDRLRQGELRRRFMACTTSIGPGALNMVTSARWHMSIDCRFSSFPATFFANRRPDPVLSKWRFRGRTISANDCF